MKQMDLLNIPIQEHPISWESVRNVPITSNDDQVDPLIALETGDRLHIYSAYFEAGIPGALETVFTRKSIAEKLEQLLALLPSDLGILVFDAWRPYEVQVALRNDFKAQLIQTNPNASSEEIEQILNQFVAMPSQNPTCPSPHLTGGSIDLTLFEIKTGKALDMGTAFDEMDGKSWSAAFESATTESDLMIRDHRRLLINGMLAVGFTNLPTEWWHFDYGNQLWGHYRQCHAIYGIASL